MNQTMDVVNKSVGAVTEFFQGNPFTNPVGQRIEQATDPNLASENWALNMEICDVINETEDGPKDAIRAIKKRLQQFMGKNHTAIMYTLVVLETCVKNCGKRLHIHVAQNDFMQELVKLVGPKFDPPQVVQEKVLRLIESWADAFRGHPELTDVISVYEELKAGGVDFPMTDLDNMVPIYTPAAHVSQAKESNASPQKAGQPASPGAGKADHFAKLRKDLDVVDQNLRVLREMLSELHPGQEAPEDFQLLQELYSTCRAMQSRILTLLQTINNDEVTNTLLFVNDQCNNVFEKYDRYVKNRAQSKPGTEAKGEDDQLIDLQSKADNSLNAQVAGMSLDNQAAKPVEGAGTENFDMFAQSRGTNYESSKATGSSYSDNASASDTVKGLGVAAQQKGSFGPSETPGDKEQDLKEMEAWMQGQPVAHQEGSGNTTEAFNKFLAERAESGSGETGDKAKRTEEEQQLFAL